MLTAETHQFTVGSSSGCDLILEHKGISRAHSKIYYSGDSVLLEDLNSQNGTFVLYNGEFKRVRSAKIKLDTVVRFGTSMSGIEVGNLIKNYISKKERDKKDISKRVKSVGLKRCGDCGSVMAKSKIHCECCGAIFEESA